MVKIGNVWESTTDVLAGRTSTLASLAALAFFLPAAAQAAITAYGGASPGAALLSALVGLAAIVITLWGQFAIIAVASDPATTRGQAGAIATRRLPAGLLVTLVLVAVLVVALLPAIVVLVASGFDFQAASGRAGSAAMPPIPPGAALFILFYGLLLIVAALWLAARLFLTNAVIVNERRGIGALGRSLQLTRGLTLKLIAVALLFVIVYGVAALAVQSVVFILFRLLLGPDQIATATLLGAVAAAAIGAVFSTIVAVFAARLYAALQGGQPGVAPTK